MIGCVATDGNPDSGGVFRPTNRPRILNLLAHAARYRIAAVIAPAGFGKSVAIRQFLETSAASVLYDVPTDAKTLAPFVRGFADALHEVAPGMRPSLVSALGGIRDADSPGYSLAVWASTHLRSVTARIVIDDLHVSENDVEITRFISTLIDRTKDGPRWLLSSRGSHQLPIASWNAYGDLDLVVDAMDLRFTLAEAKQSAVESGVVISDEELDAILSLVDGWPVAIAFALRTSTRAQDLRAVSAGTREMVYRYLAEQVWDSLDERLTSFLRTAAFLPRLETRLAVAAGFDDAAAIIESLRECVAFIAPLGPGVYKLHELFRDFVQRQIQLEGNQALCDATTAVARVLERVGMSGAALDRYVDARSVDDVVRVLAEHNFQLLENGHYDIVARALRLVPPATSVGVPGILALRAAIEDSHGRVDQAARWYKTVLRCDLPDISFRVSVAWRYALLEYQRRRLDALPELEELIEAPGLTQDDRAQVFGMLAITYAASGRPNEANDAINQALELSALANDEIRARTYGRAANVAFFVGDDSTLENYSREGTRLAMEAGAFALGARILTVLSSYHHLAGRLPIAAQYAAQVAANAEKGGDPQMQAAGLRSLVEMEAEMGNFQRVDEVERELTRLKYRGYVALFAEIGGRAVALAARGQLKEAQALILGLSERDVLPHQRAYRFALLALVAAGANDPVSSNDALRDFDNCTKVERTTDVFARLSSIASRFIVLTNIALGRNVVARRNLRALEDRSGQFEAFDSALLSLLNRQPESLEVSLSVMRGHGQAGFAKLVEVVGLRAVQDADRRAEPGIGLTTAEIEVLKGMSQGLTNQAIADEQRRTINTVRTHVSSILRKFGSTSRGEAVAAALRRGII